MDFRDSLAKINPSSVELLLTDPPWKDGNAYFEKAQLYHPWMNYRLEHDSMRLAKEFVITDAPSRKKDHDEQRWWMDCEELFSLAHKVLKPLGYLALFFRPIPPNEWLTNLNDLKLKARKTGFEPLLSIDVASSDPSMRIQQSASYVFSKDVIMIFIKIPEDTRRWFYNEEDLDQIVFQTAEILQEELHSPFTYDEWRARFSKHLVERGVGLIDAPRNDSKIYSLFRRYCEKISGAKYLPKPLTPFSGQLFDLPAVERLFTYIPMVIEELTRDGKLFSYDRFLLRLSEFVENGTRSLIDQVQKLDIRGMIKPYAVAMDKGRYFKKRALPKLPKGLKNVLELKPHEFEAFVGKLLEALGFSSIVLVGRTGDRGVDLVGYDPKKSLAVIQCKRYFRNKVSATPIQRLHSFAVSRKASRKLLITTSSFTKDAKQEAKITGTELIDGRKLESMIALHLKRYFSK